MNWLNILESHFNHRKKAFLIFDDNHVLRYISDLAREILEFDETLMGFVTLNELFPPIEKIILAVFFSINYHKGHLCRPRDFCHQPNCCTYYKKQQTKKD